MKGKKSKPRKNPTKEVSARQAQVLTYLALGKRVREIAQILGVCDDSIRRDIGRLRETGAYNNKIDLELEKHKLLWDKAYVCAMANLDAGNWQTARDILKYTGVWLDRMEIQGKIEPGDQQKKMMENVEKLLKIQAQPQQVEAEVVKSELVQGTDEQGKCTLEEHNRTVSIPCKELTCTCPDDELVRLEHEPSCPMHKKKEGLKPRFCHCACVTEEDFKTCDCPADHQDQAHVEGRKAREKEGGTPDGRGEQD